MSKPTKYMSVAEAAKKWGLTPRNVQLHCEKGNVPRVTVQGHLGK